MSKGASEIVAVVLIGDGLDESMLAEVRAWAPTADVLIAANADEAARHLRGVTPPDAQTSETAASDAGLTQREHEVLIALADGRTPAYIARELDIALSTTRGHAKQLREKLDCTSTLQAVITGARLGLIPGVQWPSPGSRSVR